MRIRYLPVPEFRQRPRDRHRIYPSSALALALATLAPEPPWQPPDHPGESLESHATTGTYCEGYNDGDNYSLFHTYVVAQQR